MEEDHRKFSRHGVTARMSYQFAADERFFDGECLNISGSGILFVSTEKIGVGKALHISIEPENRVMPTLAAYVEVIRNDDSDSGKFLTACVIKAIRGV